MGAREFKYFVPSDKYLDSIDRNVFIFILAFDVKDNCTAVQSAGGQPAKYRIKLAGMATFQGFCEETRDRKCNLF